MGDLCSLELPEHNLGEDDWPRILLPGGDGGLLGDEKGWSLAGVQLLGEARDAEEISNRC